MSNVTGWTGKLLRVKMPTASAAWSAAKLARAARSVGDAPRWTVQAIDMGSPGMRDGREYGWTVGAGKSSGTVPAGDSPQPFSAHCALWLQKSWGRSPAGTVPNVNA